MSIVVVEMRGEKVADASEEPGHRCLDLSVVKLDAPLGCLKGSKGLVRKGGTVLWKLSNSALDRSY